MSWLVNMRFNMIKSCMCMNQYEKEKNLIWRINNATSWNKKKYNKMIDFQIEKYLKNV